MDKSMSEGQRAYEAKRAAKAGMSLEKWMGQKAREREQEQKALERAQKQARAEPKKPGLIGRLLDRAHKPLKKG